MRAFYHVSLWYEKVDLSQAASRGVRTTSEEFVNAALFLRLDLKFVPSTLARHENDRSFCKTFPARRDNHLISLTEFSSDTNLKWPVIATF